MTSRKLTWIAFRTIAAVGALFVSLRGIWNIRGLDFHIDTLISVLYCLLPFLSLFVFLFAKPAKREALLQAILVGGYLSANTFLNWRTCMANGYCTTVGSTIAETLGTRQALAAVAVVVLTAIALLFDARPPAQPGSPSAH